MEQCYYKLFGMNYMFVLHFAHSSMSFCVSRRAAAPYSNFSVGSVRVKFGPAACLLFSIPVTVGLQNPEMVQFLVTLALILRMYFLVC
jgi:hypothetical protein